MKRKIRANLILRVLASAMVLWAMVTAAANDPDLPGATPNFQTIPAGSLVIPMCTNLQALAGTPFNMKSYGLINALLHTNIPVKWAIAAGKAKDGIDFTANASRILPTSTTASNVSFRSGPFIVTQAYTNQAMSIISNWDNKVAIYRLNADTTVDVRYTVCHKPRVAVLDDGNTQNIQTSILVEAGVPTNHYIVLHAADVAFLAASDCYTLVTSPHFEGGITATNQTHSIRDFVMNGGNFLAQCAAVDTYEDNVLYGYFQTTKGVAVDNVAKSFVYRNPDMAFNQFQGDLANEGGHTQEWDLKTGSSFTNNGYAGVLNGSNTNNIRAAVAKLFPGKPGSVVFYLGGHDYSGNTLPYYNGRRMYMNALFVPPDRPAGCVIVFQTDLAASITNNVNAVTNGQNITYTIVVTNSGPGRVEGASVTDVFPSTLQNLSWTSITNGGASADSTAGSGNINNTVSMPILSSIIYTVHATVAPDAATSIIDSVSVALPVGMTDLTPSNNVASITNRLTIIAKPPPDVTVSCVAQVPAAATGLSQFLAQGGTAASPLCGQPTAVVWNGDVSNGGAGCIASPLVLTRTYTVTTGCGDVSSVSQHITVIDTNAPVITAFPPDVTFTCANQVPAANDASVQASDNCSGTVTVTHDADVVTGGSCANRFTIARTYRVSDSCGNSVSQTQHLTVNNQSAPSIVTFPADATYSCANGVPAANDSLVSATDNCSGAAAITHAPDVITSSNCVNRFTIVRTYIATDACGNSSSRTQTITVNATTPPTFVTFPADATYSCASAVPAADNSTATATSACGSTSDITITHDADVVVTTNCANRFTIARTYRATDACGNTATRTQTITVNSTVAPTITTFPADASYSCSSAVPSANDSLVTATDNCGGSATIQITHNADIISSSNCVNHLTISRTYVATDACGNSSSKTQTITVNGTTPPTITGFPADATYSCAGGVPPADDSLVTAVDNCGAAVVTVTHDNDIIMSSNCVNRVTIQRTYHVTDACGNATSKTQNITVNGTSVPIITTFPADASYSCSDSVPPADNSVVVATNACGGTVNITITHSADVITASNCVNHFTITRTYTATDACGNSSSKSQTIIVNDSIPPTITGFPADATYSCAGSVPSPDDSLVTATDNCGTAVTVTHDKDFISSSNCVNRLTIQRTYRVSDACGNSIKRTQIITVNGTTAPVITTFPADTSYSCASAVPAADNSLVIATNACGGSANIAINHGADVVSGSNCVNHFTISRTYSATDACGNSSSKTQTIIINGTTPPTITGFPGNLSLSCAGNVPAPNDTLVTATDNCGGSSVVITHTPDLITESNCPNHFTVTRTYIATDACGNSTSRNQTITVNDTTPPSIRPPLLTNMVFACASEVPAANDSLINAVDNCSGNVFVTHEPDSLIESNCPNRFTLRRVYHIADSCGNTTNWTQTITVHDVVVPTITAFPFDATYTCASAVPAPDDTLMSATDGCGGGVHITHNADVIVSAVCDNRYTIHRTYIATDACGNSTSATQTFTINNTTPPTITQFPADATFACAGQVPAANDALVIATNACGDKFGMVITHSADVINASNCVNRFTISRTYTATDNCGNATTRTQTITVNATTPPTITTFPADATYSCPSAVPAADNTLVAAIDGCGAHSLVITHGADVVTSSNCVDRFTITRTYTATDACGNSSSKVQTITVNATTPPTIATFPPDATYKCASAVPAADDTSIGATDGCGSAALVITHGADVITSSNCVNRFTITRTYTATDACGNSASKTQTITVNGITPPTITAFPADVTFACAGSVPAADDTLVSANDNCGAASVTVTHDSDVIVSNICVNNFIIQRTYHVTDACGNVTNRTQTITVNDNIAPEITCPPGFTVSLWDDVPFPNIEQVIATDNCGIPSKAFLGATYVTNNNIVTITRVFVATDDCGNSSTCSQVITMNPYLATGTANPDFYSTFENQTLNVAAPGVLGNDTDPNNLPLQAILVTGPTNGTLTLNSNGSFQYVPNTNFNGSDAFIYQASNGGTTTAPVVVSITVTFVNQAPSFTKGPNQIVNNYDPAQTRVGWASNIKAGPANESSQTVQFIVNNDNNSIFSVQPAISPNGTLTYAPAVGHYGTTTVSVKIKDNGGTASGGVDTSATQMFSILVNNPPSATINMPTNTSLFLYPSPVDIIATATDIDGTVTNLTFLNGTNVIGQGIPTGNNTYTLMWTNAPATNSVLYALATDNYGATNLSPPINVQLGNPVLVTAGAVGFSPSLLSWAQRLSVTNPTISIVQSVTITFTSIGPPGTSIVGVTGTNQFGQPYITFNNTVPPVTGIDNYATILYVATSQPIVSFTTSASLSPGPGFTVIPSKIVPITREQLQNDGSLLLNFLTQSNHVYFVQYTKDFQTWFTSPVPLHGNGTTLQWLDFGPNVTESRPRTVPYRFYRVVAQ